MTLRTWCGDDYCGDLPNYNRSRCKKQLTKHSTGQVVIVSGYKTLEVSETKPGKKVRHQKFWMLDKYYLKRSKMLQALCGQFFNFSSALNCGIQHSTVDYSSFISSYPLKIITIKVRFSFPSKKKKKSAAANRI